MPLWLGGLIATAGGAVASALVSRASRSSEQKEIEKQIKLQHELEIQRMLVEQQSTGQAMSYAVPLLGGLVLLMFLR